MFFTLFPSFFLSLIPFFQPSWLRQMAACVWVRDLFLLKGSVCFSPRTLTAWPQRELLDFYSKSYGKVTALYCKVSWDKICCDLVPYTHMLFIYCNWTMFVQVPTNHLSFTLCCAASMFSFFCIFTSTPLGRPQQDLIKLCSSVYQFC